MRRLQFWSLTILLCVSSSLRAAPSGAAIEWRQWDEGIFKEAKVQHKLVILDLQAVWCHWCHVMEATTYKDAKIVAEVNKDYIAVQADQDANPALARTYEDYGWPATIVFDADGHELLKKAGYVSAEQFIEVLADLAKNPVPLASEKEVSSKPVARSALEQKASKKIVKSYDKKVGGWLGSHKYLDRDFILDQLVLANDGDSKAKARVEQTLDGARKIIDPVWGGLYQYSVDGDWAEPHYEKLLVYQSDAIVAYVAAYAALGNAKDLESSRKIAAYVDRFLTAKDGSFYTSQDADAVPGEQGDEYFKLNDAERVAKGIPKVDQNVYSRENGGMIEALVRLYEVTGDKTVLDKAIRAANVMVASRGLEDGQYRHSEKDVGAAAQPSLGDQLAMGKALLALYEATGNREDLKKAMATATFIQQTFAQSGGGFLAFAPDAKAKVVAPKAGAEENIALARFANSLAAYGGRRADREMAESAFKFALESDVLDRIYLLSSILLAQRELGRAPLHITVVGAKDDPVALALQQSALSYPETFKRIEWLDRKEGPLANSDVSFPELKKPVAFVCTGNLCSTPMSDPNALHAQIKRVSKLK